MRSVISVILFLSTVFLLALVSPALAYVGPGAGFAVMTSFFAFFVSFLLALLSFLFWPLRLLQRLWKNRKNTGKKLAKRVVILGFDGMDARLTEQWMDEGRLPNLKKLKDEGGFRPLETTFPSVSPVAWSTFSTGVNPGKHNIFDFLSRDKNTYLPLLSSTELLPPEKKISFLKYSIPVGKSKIRFLRKSKSFWKILGERGVFSSIIRVPVTFPPEKFFGTMLSGMCVPDLHGTQGSFTYLTSRGDALSDSFEGRVVRLERSNGSFHGIIPGPPHPFLKENVPLTIRFRIKDVSPETADLYMEKKRYHVHVGEASDWIPIVFRFGPGLSVRGNAQFFVSELGAEARVYMSPVNLDPAKPVMPISHPQIYSAYLAMQQGVYATLGLAEDTWALNEGVLAEGAFIKQVEKIHQERLRMFWSSFNSIREGVVTCVFDTTDRTQHMFMRYLDPAHPGRSREMSPEGRNAIRDCYRKMDELVGEVLEKTGKNTILFVMSDHGFKSFRRGFHLNAWLRKEGYLCVREDVEDGDWFSRVDWTRTKAYGLGLTGLYVNQKGREAKGIVAEGEEKEELLNEIREKLLLQTDGVEGEKVFLNVYKTSEIYTGPYKQNAPDIILGYNDGYRVSWDSVVGRVDGELLEDNLKSWSGDHCIDPPRVPGILFANRKIEAGTSGIQDMAPTVLKIFGIPVPSFMDGKPLL